MPGALHKRAGSMLVNGRLGGDAPNGNARAQRRLLAKQIEKRLSEHPCGDCTACCTVKQVAEIDKPEHVPCDHLNAPTKRPGCSIYADRPHTCQEYFCAWRYGLIGGGEELRPNRLGLLFDVAEKPPPGVLMLAVREVVPGAINAHQKELNEVAARGIVLYLMVGDRRYFMGPEEKVFLCQEFSRRQLPLVAR